MALTIHAEWSKPLPLSDGSRVNLIYKLDDIESIPEKPGVYVFARSHGDNIRPVYIGQADKLKTRIRQQLNNVKLMMGIKNTAKAKRILVYCEAKIGRGQDRKKVLGILENALIDHALSDGHELLNKQGTKRPAHKVEFSGNRTSEKLAPRKMFVKSALTKKLQRTR